MLVPPIGNDIVGFARPHNCRCRKNHLAGKLSSDPKSGRGGVTDKKECCLQDHDSDSSMDTPEEGEIPLHTPAQPSETFVAPPASIPRLEELLEAKKARASEQLLGTRPKVPVPARDPEHTRRDIESGKSRSDGRDRSPTAGLELGTDVQRGKDTSYEHTRATSRQIAASAPLKGKKAVSERRKTSKHRKSHRRKPSESSSSSSGSSGSEEQRRLSDLSSSPRDRRRRRRKRRRRSTPRSSEDAHDSSLDGQRRRHKHRKRRRDLGVSVDSSSQERSHDRGNTSRQSQPSIQEQDLLSKVREMLSKS